MRDEVAALADDRASSALEARHAGSFFVVRRELKLLLNDAVAIVQGTGSVRFQLRRPRRLTIGRCGRSRTAAAGLGARRAPQATASGGGRAGVSGVGGGARLRAVRAHAVVGRAKLAAGDFERLERLCARIRGPVDASLNELPRPASIGRDAPAG